MNINDIGGKLYRHYKGNIYMVIGIAKDADNGGDYVIYMGTSTGKMWSRSFTMFSGKAEMDGVIVNRFELCKDGK